MPAQTHTVVIVGARCAGAATAMLLARRGVKVLVLDRHAYGSDTLSTHVLMRGAAVQLARWGLLDTIAAAGTPPVTMTSFHYGDDEIEIAIRPGGGVEALYAPRRTLLDRVLVDAARQAGAEIRFGTVVDSLLRDEDGRVRGVIARAAGGDYFDIRADLVIGADGLRSTVARLCGATVYREARHAAGGVYGYFDDLEVDRYHWYFGDRAAASLIPTNGGAIAAMQVPSARYMAETRMDVKAGFRRVLAEVSPALADAVGAARATGPLRAFAGEMGFMRRAAGSGWALVGDAGYFKDPLTAHGITDAFRDAERLAGAVVADTPEGWRLYEAERDRLSTDLFEATDAIVSFDWDLETIGPLHRRLNETMKQEVTAILAFDRPGGSMAA